MTKETLIEIVCPICQMLCGCICATIKKHKAGCLFLRAAKLSVEIACPHGFQACPKCDPCTCGVGEKGGIR